LPDPFAEENSDHYGSTEREREQTSHTNDAIIDIFDRGRLLEAVEARDRDLEELHRTSTRQNEAAHSSTAAG
jgi:hypothetical protein